MLCEVREGVAGSKDRLIQAIYGEMLRIREG